MARRCCSYRIQTRTCHPGSSPPPGSTTPAPRRVLPGRAAGLRLAPFVPSTNPPGPGPWPPRAQSSSTIETSSTVRALPSRSRMAQEVTGPVCPLYPLGSLPFPLIQPFECCPRLLLLSQFNPVIVYYRVQSSSLLGPGLLFIGLC